jgi:hypothetical protein
MPQQTPDFLGGGSMNRGGGGLSSGMGGILATGAAAAAGAYLGNRMASGGHTDHASNSVAGHDNPAPQHLDPTNTAAAGLGGAATSSGFPALNGTGNANEMAPDYFSDLPANSEPDYFSADETSSYDDTASDDTGGGGFDDNSDNSGSW